MEKTEIKRIAMRKYRSNVSPGKREKIKAYDRQRKRKHHLVNNENSGSKLSYYKMLKNSQKIRDILGSEPNQYSKVLSHVIAKGLKSPSKSKILKEELKKIKSPTKVSESVTPPNPNFSSRGNNSEIAKKLCRLSALRSKKKHDKARKVAEDLLAQEGTVSLISKLGNVDYSAVYRLIHTPKKRVQNHYARKFSAAEEQEVMDLYYDDEVSYSLPDTRYSHLRFMRYPIRETYKKFYLPMKKSTRPMKKSKFASLKPPEIRPVSATPLRGCKCEHCVNYGIMREALIRHKFRGIPGRFTDSIEIQWCPFRDTDLKDREGVEFPKINCVIGICEHCGLDPYRNELEKKNSELLKRETLIEWHQWDTIKSQTKKGKDNRKLKQVLIGGTVEMLFEDYMEKLEFMSFHQFSKIWQMKQFNLCRRNLRKGQIILVHDFSQNILLYAAEEPQGAHWDHQQITVHPTVCYYLCENGFLVREEAIHITNKTEHNRHWVKAFRDETVAHLKSNNVPIQEIIEWTDNAGSQYKSCGFFLELTRIEIPLTHHFFAAQHGKSPSDRAGAYFKNFVKQTVKSGKVVLLDCCDLVGISKIKYEKQERCDRNSLCSHEGKHCKSPGHCLRKVIYTTELEPIDEFDKVRKRIDGTQDLFCVRNTHKTGVVETRRISCCCSACLFGGDCQFKLTYTDDWLKESVSKLVTERKLKEIPTSDILAWRLKATREIRNQEPQATEKIRNLEQTNFTPARKVRRCDGNSLPSSFDQKFKKSSRKEITISSGNTSASTQQNGTVTFDWNALMNKIAAVESYEAVSKIICENPIPNLKMNRKSCLSSADEICRVALHFLPKDGPKDFVPVKTIGDGSCFPRALSHAVFGTQARHREMRIRLIYEAVTNSNRYLNSTYLRLGTSLSDNAACQYALYTGHEEITHTKLTRAEVLHFYKEDVMRISEPSGYMGIWQFHQAAEITKIPIGSVHPRIQRKRIRRDFNRIILPENPSFHNKTPIYIMWSPLSKACLPSEVKHFVTLFPQSERYDFISRKKESIYAGHEIRGRNVNREIYPKILYFVGFRVHHHRYM